MCEAACCILGDKAGISLLFCNKKKPFSDRCGDINPATRVALGDSNVHL